MKLLQASIVYCMPNVASKNNLFKYSYNGTNYSYILPVGLYTLDSLNKTISIHTLKQTGNEYIFYFQADDATSQIQVYFTAVACSIDCSGSTNIMSNLLGFENDISIGDFTVADDTAYSTGTFKAQINSLQNILIRSSITQSCSYLNNNSDNRSTIYFSLVNPTTCNINVNTIQQLTIELVDQNGSDLDFTSEIQIYPNYGVLLNYLLELLKYYLMGIIQMLNFLKKSMNL